VASSEISPLTARINSIVGSKIQARIAITCIADISLLTSHLTIASITSNSSIASSIRPMPSMLLDW
jgi:hypothetical protein